MDSKHCLMFETTGDFYAAHLTVSAGPSTCEQKNVSECSELKQCEHDGQSKECLKMNHEEMTCECKLCGQIFDIVTLKTHLGIKTEDVLLLQCEHCGKRFDNKSELEKHLRVHTGNSPYEFENYVNNSVSSGNLKVHTTYECFHCGKKFQHSSKLKRHLRIHNGETPYECEHCGKKFTQNSTLKTHLMIHTGEKPYKCEYCGKRFNRNTSLKTHLMIHTGERPYECEHCRKRFESSSKLKRHLRIHTKEMPYECEHCEKKFNQNIHLKKHLIMHTGESRIQKGENLFINLNIAQRSLKTVAISENV
ncbi:zinc finger protein 85-like [Anneissia japonica]|uniref:zinc finger protein 85-like n=1 Tax=Anneissia japonica TaxID=1529436 RepID=UPI0014256D7E|nr:zinc finger protein 85-like [Anneissia japonica]